MIWPGVFDDGMFECLPVMRRPLQEVQRQIQPYTDAGFDFLSRLCNTLCGQEFQGAQLIIFAIVSVGTRLLAPPLLVCFSQVKSSPVSSSWTARSINGSRIADG